MSAPRTPGTKERVKMGLQAPQAALEALGDCCPEHLRRWLLRPETLRRYHGARKERENGA